MRHPDAPERWSISNLVLSPEPLAAFARAAFPLTAGLEKSANESQARTDDWDSHGRSFPNRLRHGQSDEDLKSEAECLEAIGLSDVHIVDGRVLYTIDPMDVDLPTFKAAIAACKLGATPHSVYTAVTGERLTMRT